jgi:hypothetical protein
LNTAFILVADRRTRIKITYFFIDKIDFYFFRLTRNREKSIFHPNPPVGEEN